MQLKEAGQSIWLDLLRRTLITSGGLQRLIDQDGLGGVTSNPTIFSKAIGGSTDYDEAIREIAEKNGRDAIDIFYDLALEDIRMAADVFRPVYEAASRADGFVSFELEPRLAHDTRGSIDKALELFRQMDKPNVMIKVPGTPEGVAAVEELTALGVNVNITLLFSVSMYERVALAYIAGLEKRMAAGEPLDHVASVASFFVSRVDSAVESRLNEDSSLRGKIAVANAKMAYERFTQIFFGDRWETLARAGAKVQKPLWASTGTKNAAYSDVLYVEELVGPDTVNTMPQQTMDAFRDHGRVRPNAALEGWDEAKGALLELEVEGIDLEEINEGLVRDGIASFDKDLNKLLETIERKVSEVRQGKAPWKAVLGDLQAPVKRRVDKMHDDDVVSRIWRRDHTVWAPAPDEISDRLGWLNICDLMNDRIADLQQFAEEVKAAGFNHAVLLGMGGSSLAPQVLQDVLGTKEGFLSLSVLDTTHPETISRLERSLDLEHTLFIVASKSGGTIETLSHFSFFFEKAGRGHQFIAITDPGSHLEALARQNGFRRVFLNPPDIGGRFSALSLFGLVPAALIGADLDRLLDQMDEAAHACHEWMHPEENPGAWLGAAMGEAALAGRDKLTLVLPPALASFGDWAEQLVAESTGKDGKGIVPIVGEDLGDSQAYGTDRFFVSLAAHLSPGSEGLGEKLAALENAGHPLVRLAEESAPGGGEFSLGAEFFRFEFAIAVAGYVLSINAFDQPNVAEAKQATAEILEAGGVEDPGFDDVGSLLTSVQPGDYLGIHAYLDRTPELEATLKGIRLALRDRLKVATTVGFGPRFLHSTGQLHKGGPATGAFIQIVDDGRSEDLAVPGKPFTFGTLLGAQALGDLRALQGRGRRIARTSLTRLEAAL